MYWTDSEYRHVMVAKLDGRHQAVFMQDRVDQPRGIVVDAINRSVKKKLNIVHTNIRKYANPTTNKCNDYNKQKNQQKVLPMQHRNKNYIINHIPAL